MKPINKILALCFVLLASLFFLTSCTFTKTNEKKVLRLGFMPNVTHATALVSIEKGFFQEELGNKIKFKPIHFVVGNSIIDAFITGQLDVAYVGPGPYLNAIYRKVPIKLLANACNGGTVFVGALHATPLQDGMRISVPQYGNTQDLILRSYLEKNNLLNKVKIFAIPPQDTGTAFFTMSVDAACLPEPWGTILIVGALHATPLRIIVDQNDILNNGNYPVTLLVVNDNFQIKNPELVSKILIAHKKANDFINKNPNEAISLITQAISKISQKQINEDVIARSFNRCNFKSELDLKMLEEFKSIAIKAGYYRKGFLKAKNENHIN